MKYDESMVTNKVGWTKAVEEEHERMIKNNVWIPVKLQDLLKDTKLLTTTWAYKLKSNERKRARINSRGYKQINRVHYNESSIHSPVTNDISFCIIMIMALMAGCNGLINDVQGDFLRKVKSEDGEYGN